METRGRNVAKIELNTDELGYLQTLLRRRNLPQGESRRARALMRMHEGLNNKTIAEEVGVCAHTVSS
ncbi:helix-turn-helix domain-containing protein, partial [Cerasicoccus maritimus]|uniref:helix-turn-helix domain-containing protein n=1 Tax=Cerasicoccus maritimus TaxID=490089 RepID=UPI002852CCB9